MFSYSGEGLPLNIQPSSLDKLNVQASNMHAHLGHYMPPESQGALDVASAINPFANFQNQRPHFPYTSLTPNRLRESPSFSRESVSHVSNLNRAPANLSRDSTIMDRNYHRTVKDLTSISSSFTTDFSMLEERYRSIDFDRLDLSKNLLNIPNVKLPIPCENRISSTEQNGFKYSSYEESMPTYFDIKPNVVPQHIDVHKNSFSELDKSKSFTKPYENEIQSKPTLTDKTAVSEATNFDGTNADHNFVSKNTLATIDAVEIESEKPNIKSEIEPKTSRLEISVESVETTEAAVETWTDTEYAKPFVKDKNGFTKEQVDLSRYTLIDANDSSTAAVNALKAQGDNFSTVYQCVHCGLHFRHPKRFLVHYKWHAYGQTNERRRQVNEQKVLRRLSRKKPADKPASGDEGAFPCECCDQAFGSSRKLVAHRNKVHLAGQPKECRVCRRAFPTLEEMRAHTRSAHTDPRSDAKFMCDECPKTFKFMHSLLRHQAIHMEKKFSCTQCDKKFGSDLLLGIHIKTHEKMQRGMTYHCSYCAKGFYHSYNLAIHERGHRGERPFQCDICKSSYATNSSLKRHLKVSHNTSKPYECAVCRRSFVSEQIRQRHALRAHSAASAQPAARPPRRRRRPKGDD